MSEAERLRARAKEYRALALTARDQFSAERLVDLAEQFEAEAARLDDQAGS